MRISRTPSALFVSVFAGIMSLAISSFTPLPQDDYAGCFIVKKKGFGTSKYETERYVVTLENTCDKKLDVQISIKKKDGKWESSLIKGVKFRGTATGACYPSAGEFKFYARLAGSTQSFPKNSEIQ
ncbi:MAG: hypothetical protein EOO15_03135 [Chitinophagaceae bacterium]|nr:MAG: hypothetical protein EOO15_03135 [Chitinophagaceae bacterium]